MQLPAADKMKDIELLDHLHKNGVRVVLHGDVHEMQRELLGYWRENKLHIVGAGSFGGTRSGPA